MVKCTFEGLCALYHKKFCFNWVRLSVKCWFFVFDEEHFIN